MTSNRTVMADINKIFAALKKPKLDLFESLKPCKSLLVCPTNMRLALLEHLDKEIVEARSGRKAQVIIKVNSLSDKILIRKLYDAAEAGVKIEMIVREINRNINQKKLKVTIRAINNVDEYLENTNVMYFYAAGKETVYISSADRKKRSLDHRI